jgi:hypothetical protein
MRRPARRQSATDSAVARILAPRGDDGHSDCNDQFCNAKYCGTDRITSASLSSIRRLT